MDKVENHKQAISASTYLLPAWVPTPTQTHQLREEGRGKGAGGRRRLGSSLLSRRGNCVLVDPRSPKAGAGEARLSQWVGKVCRRVFMDTTTTMGAGLQFQLALEFRT